MKKVLGTKMKMSQLFEDTIVIPVTPIAVSKDDVGHFEKGAHVKVRAVSKGKGFQGVVKRWNFGGGPKTHGQKHSHRAPGSIGATGPQRVIKGLKMAGRMGGVNVTVRNLKLVDINSEKNTVFVRGAVPGNVGGRVEVCVEEKAKADKKASE